MKIICTGPNGERFEGEAVVINDVNAGSYDNKFKEVHSRNEIERAALQKALETWCELTKANIKEARIIGVDWAKYPSTRAEAEHLHNFQICRICKSTLGMHRADGLNCPAQLINGVSHGWSETTFKRQ